MTFTAAETIEVAEYRYFTTDISTGKVIMEVPFGDVSWERKISSAGSFSGSIPADPSQDHFDLYNSTLPGKRGLYIVRNGLCVWGGIIWSRDYSITERKLSISALEWDSYLHHRVFWKSINFPANVTIKKFIEDFMTYSFNDEEDLVGPNNAVITPQSNEYIGYSASDLYSVTYAYQRSSTNTIRIYLKPEEQHTYAVGDVVRLGGFGSASIEAVTYGWNNINVAVTSVSTDMNSFTFTAPGAVPSTTLVTLGEGSSAFNILSSYYTTVKNSAKVAMTWSIDSDLNDYITTDVDAADIRPFTFRGVEMRYIGEIFDNLASSGVQCHALTARATKVNSTTYNNLTYYAAPTANTVVFTTQFAHGYTAGNQVTISGTNFDGTYSISSPSTYTFTVTTVTTHSTASTTSLMGSRFLSTRFDYFIDCSYDASTHSFVNTLRAWVVRKDRNDPLRANDDNQLSLETLYGPSKLHAGNFVFEHPGNITELTLSENADSSATRTWVVDSGGDLSNSKYYASYTNIRYIQEGWPLLETASTDRNLNVFTDQMVNKFALNIGYRLAPPIGQFNVTVNGSIEPKVGTYKPGDWCIVIPGDTFINNRLQPPYEDRTGLLVRKILSMKVNVPNNPAFPETVELELIPEWEVTASA